MATAGNCFFLHSHQSLSIATLAAGMFTVFGVGIDVCTTFAVRHGNVTSVRDVVLFVANFLVFVVRIPCHSKIMI